MKTAIMIDGAFLRKKYRAAYKKSICADEINNFVEKLFSVSSIDSRESHRVYFYDCKPCSKKSSLPVSHKIYDFAETPQYREDVTLLEEIKKLDYFAVREGQLSFAGWKLKKRCYNQNAPYTDESFEPDLKQKGTDIKIGLDIAWASYNKIANYIFLVTGDSDFVPAIKTARRNGLFVYLFTLNHMVKPDLLNNADVCKTQSIKDILSVK